MAYKRTRKGAMGKRRFTKRGFGIKRSGRKITATKVAKISKAVMMKNSETKFTRIYSNFWVINFARKVTGATRDLINSSANPSIVQMVHHPFAYTGAVGGVTSNYSRIGNKIENAKVYACIRLNFMNWMPRDYEWAWKYAQCRLVVFSPLETGFDQTVNVPNFFISAIDTNYNSVAGQPSLMDVPINRTKYRVYFDKICSASTEGNGGSNTISEINSVFIKSVKYNINQRLGDIIYRQSGENTTLTNIPKYPKFDRYIAIIPFHNISNGSRDNDTGAGLINVMTKSALYFTDS